MLTQVGEGAAEAVELPDDEHVARPERAHATVESRSVVYAGREVLVDVDGVDARSAAGTATGSRLPSSRGRSRSACIVNGRLRQTGEGAVRPAPPCSTHTSPRTTRSWPPCWRRNEPDTAAYRAHAGLERPGPLGERRARGRRLHCFVLANDVDTEAFAFTTRPRTHFMSRRQERYTESSAFRRSVPLARRLLQVAFGPRKNTDRLHVVPRHTTLKPCCTNSCSLNARLVTTDADSSGPDPTPKTQRPESSSPQGRAYIQSSPPSGKAYRNVRLSPLCPTGSPVTLEIIRSVSIRPAKSPVDCPNAANRRCHLRQQCCITGNPPNVLRPLRRRLNSINNIRSIRPQTIASGEQNNRENPDSNCCSTVWNPRPTRPNEADRRRHPQKHRQTKLIRSPNLTDFHFGKP